MNYNLMRLSGQTIPQKLKSQISCTGGGGVLPLYDIYPLSFQADIRKKVLTVSESVHGIFLYFLV